jgi:hypothetical protein
MAELSSISNELSSSFIWGIRVPIVYYSADSGLTRCGRSMSPDSLKGIRRIEIELVTHCNQVYVVRKYRSTELAAKVNPVVKHRPEFP